MVSTLVIGVGNTLRGDDGVAARVIALMAMDASGEIALRTTLSLLPELAAELPGHGRVIFVDADVSTERIVFEPLSDERDGLHRIAPTSVVAMARVLGFAGDAWVCRLPIESLNYGEGLSARAADVACEAARLLLERATLR